MHAVDLISSAIQRALEEVPREAAADYVAALKDKDDAAIAGLEELYPAITAYPLDSRNRVIELKHEPYEATCALTGETRQCVPIKDCVSSNFTEWDVLTDPETEMMCVEAYYALKFRWERFSSWLCSRGKFVRVDKDIIRDVLFNGFADAPWSMFITTSYKKHGALRCPVNTGNHGYIGFDEAVIDCRDSDYCVEVYDHVFAAFARGANRNDLESLRPSKWTLKALGIKGWQEYKAWAEDKVESSLYRLCVYLLPPRKELEDAEQG